MIKFLTLFVGLVTGMQDVEVSTSAAVARIEIQLNGAVVASKSEPPWRLRCDLGRELHPGRLEAVAFDASGREIGRDLQWINLPASRAEAAIIPTLDEQGNVVAAQLTWESPEFSRPKNLRVELDGAPVTVRAPYRIDLSASSPDEVHVLTVDFDFSSEVRLRRELVFGRGFSGAHTSGLTALPVVLDELEELPPPAELDGWFTESDGAVRVTAVERAESLLVVVRDPGTQDLLLELQQERNRVAKKKSKRRSASALDLFGEDLSIRVLIPEPVVPQNRQRATLLFPYGHKDLPGDQGLLKAACAPRNERMLGGGLMVADAVAMAGIHAAGGNRRRAVLVLLGAEREDISRLSPEAVRIFLADLRVPLYVWDLSGEGGSPPPAWQADREVSSFDDLSRSVRRLRYALDQQRLVWFSGRLLPQTLQLGPAARGISLAR